MKKGYSTDIEKETVENDDFRRVLYTAKNMQLVLMSLKPTEEIGEEVHDDVDQFIRCDAGEGVAILNGVEHVLRNGIAVIVPAGVRHNVKNVSPTEALKLYTIYTPPEHKDGTVHPTKSDVSEEHFDGQTTER